jgi:hypothetical protein
VALQKAYAITIGSLVLPDRIGLRGWSLKIPALAMVNCAPRKAVNASPALPPRIFCRAVLW